MPFKSKLSPYDFALAMQRRPGQERQDGALDGKELVRLATLAASSHNTQPWKFKLERRSITILPDFSRRCPVADPDDAHLYKSLGCAAENLVQAAAAQGHAAHVSFDGASRSVRIDLEPSRAVRAGPLFHAIPGRQCTRLPYDRKMVCDTADQKSLILAGTGEGVRTLLISGQPVRKAIIEYVRQGNMAQLSDPAFRKELVAWLRFNDKSAIRTGDGLAGRVSGKHSAPDWLAKLMIGFVLMSESQGEADTANLQSSPLIAVFVANQDTPAAWIEVGRAYQRFALQATLLDVRTAFINQPIEVPELRGRLNSLLWLKDEHALLMVRAGYGPKAPYSLRRPLEDVILD